MIARRSIAAASLIVSSWLVSGCAGSSLLEDVPSRKLWKEERKDQGYLGVVVSTLPVAPKRGRAFGARVIRVIRASPAEMAGLRAGDEIREIVLENPFEMRATAPDGPPDPRGDRPASAPPGLKVETAADLDAALRRVGRDNTATLIIARAGEIEMVPVRLASTEACWHEQSARANLAAEENKASVRIPFLFEYEHQSYDRETYRSYTGIDVSEPVSRYRDVDVLPVLFVSLFRYESVPSCDAWRLKIICWPFVFTSMGDHDASTDGIKLAGQENRIEL